MCAGSEVRTGRRVVVRDDASPLAIASRTTLPNVSRLARKQEDVGGGVVRRRAHGPSGSRKRGRRDGRPARPRAEARRRRSRADRTRPAARMARYAAMASSTFFSRAIRPTQSATRAAPEAPHRARSAASRRAGVKSRRSTPRPRSVRFSKPAAAAIPSRSALGTSVPRCGCGTGAGSAVIPRPSHAGPVVPRVPREVGVEAAEERESQAARGVHRRPSEGARASPRTPRPGAESSSAARSSRRAGQPMRTPRYLGTGAPRTSVTGLTRPDPCGSMPGRRGRTIDTTWPRARSPSHQAGQGHGRAVDLRRVGLGDERRSVVECGMRPREHPRRRRRETPREDLATA